MIYYSKLKRVFLLSFLLILTAVANITIKIVPFKKMMAVLTNTDELVSHELNKSDRYRLLLVLRYLERIEKLVPWRVLCFEQGIVMLIICRIMKIDVNVFFGIKRNEDNKILAHAWTQTGKIGLTGIVNAHEYYKVYTRGYLS